MKSQDTKNRVYSFGRFYDPKKVQQAVSALLSAGIPRAQIKVLEPSPSAERSNVNAPEQKTFALMGLLGGILAGALAGLIVFVIPSWLLDFRYENAMAIVGFVICVGAGATVGALHSLQLSRRRSGDHVIGPDEHGVFVTVHEGQEEQLNRAKDQFERMDFANA